MASLDDQKLKHKQFKRDRLYGCFCCPLPARCYKLDELPKDWNTKPLTLKGYRVNLGWIKSFFSIFDPNHNEFWMIWSDIVPLVLYICLFVLFFYTNSSDIADRGLECMVFIGIIVCRSLSAFYHIFNCVNEWTNQRLIFVDLIGISFMCLTAPFFYELGGSGGFYTYCMILFSLVVVCNCVFVFNMVYGESEILSFCRQPLLCLMAAIANWTAVRIMLNSNLAVDIRIYSAISFFCLLGGYLLCYVHHIPELCFPLGLADGKIWNSHVIWHFLLFISQTVYLTTRHRAYPAF